MTERDLKRFTTYLTVERGLSPGTVKKYIYGVKLLKAWARDKRMRLSELKITHCRRWLIGLAKETYKPSTVNGMHSAASLFFRFLITEGNLVTNPFEQISYIREEKPLPRFLSREEVEHLMTAPDTSTYAGLLDRTVMELFYSSGIRVAELINLRLDEVDLKRRLILCTGKGSKQRLVVVGGKAQKWLKKYLAARAHIPGASKSPYLFLKSDGKPLYGTFVWRHIKEHGLMVGLKDVSPHMLRHSFATHLHEGGASTRHVQLLLGHEGPESTEVYTHVLPTHLRKTYDQYHPRSGLKRGPPHSRHRQLDPDNGESVE